MTAAAPVVPDRRPAPWALILAFGLVYVCWGTTYLALKKGVREEQWPPGLFSGVRLGLAGLILLVWQALRGQPLLLPARDRLQVAFCAVLLFVAGNGLLTVAGQTLDSGLCAVLAATTPLWAGLFELCWPQGDRLSGRGWLGLALGLAGVSILCVPQLQASTNIAPVFGILCMLGSASCWALGSLVGRHRRLSCSHWTAAGYQLFLGGTALALIGIACGELQRMPGHVTLKAAGAFAWLLIVGSLVGYVAFNWLLAHVSVTQVGTYAYVNPVIAVIIGILDYEEPTVWLFAAMAVILVGIAFVRGGLRKGDKVETCRTNIAVRPVSDVRRS
jgi:drug/metabolite transporter (DMT)-like permease